MFAKKSVVYFWFGGSPILFLVFLILKLMGNINWSWWAITAPLWIPPVMTLTYFFALIMLTVIWYGLDKVLESWK